MHPGAQILPFGGMSPRIDDSAFVAPGAVVIGDVEIGPEASIWYGCVLRGDVAPIRVGARTNIQDGTVIHVNAERGDRPHMPSLIGADITVGHMALLHACTLEDGAFVGMRAVVMDAAVVESGAMVAAGALLTPNKRVPRGELWAGSPARFARGLGEAELAYFPESVAHYCELAARHKSGG